MRTQLTRRLRFGKALLVLMTAACPAYAELVLYTAGPEAWQAALDAFAEERFEDALVQFAALDRQERDHAEETDSIIPLTRFFLLKSLAGMGREEDLVKRIHLLEPDRLPPAFQREAQILQLEVDRMQDRATRVVQLAGALLQDDLSPSQGARIAWLYADALTELGREEEALDALANSIVSSDIDLAKDAAEAMRELADLLDGMNATEEADSLRLLQSVLAGAGSEE